MKSHWKEYGYYPEASDELCACAKPLLAQISGTFQNMGPTFTLAGTWGWPIAWLWPHGPQLGLSSQPRAHPPLTSPSHPTPAPAPQPSPSWGRLPLALVSNHTTLGKTQHPDKREAQELHTGYSTHCPQAGERDPFKSPSYTPRGTTSL